MVKEENELKAFLKKKEIGIVCCWSVSLKMYINFTFEFVAKKRKKNKSDKKWGKIVNKYKNRGNRFENGRNSWKFVLLLLFFSFFFFALSYSQLSKYIYIYIYVLIYVFARLLLFKCALMFEALSWKLFLFLRCFSSGSLHVSLVALCILLLLFEWTYRMFFCLFSSFFI